MTQPTWDHTRLLKTLREHTLHYSDQERAATVLQELINDHRRLKLALIDIASIAQRQAEQ